MVVAQDEGSAGWQAAEWLADHGSLAGNQRSLEVIVIFVLLLPFFMHVLVGPGAPKEAPQGERSGVCRDISSEF